MGGRGGSSGLSSANRETSKSLKIDFSNLPELSGSQKQVEWAEQIRDNVVHTINNNIERMENADKDARRYYQPQIEAFREIGEKVNAMLRQPQAASAANIIDRRHSALNTEKLLRMVNDLGEKKRRERK